MPSSEPKAPDNTEFDLACMQRCFALAEQGRYGARPNPVVGCVIARDGKIIAEGWHKVCGQAHAEIEALLQVAALEDTSLTTATLYVSLEPCSFQGKTGPCSEAVINNGVSRVVYAMQDPNPQVAGKGLEAIAAAGIEISGPLLEDEAQKINPGFIKRMTQGLPYVRCKMGMSLDGKTAMASGESQWITGEAARADVQMLRARSCVILSGIGTVLKDDPSLTARLPDEEYNQPLRIIVDSTLKISEQAKVLSGSGEILIATAISDVNTIKEKENSFSGDSIAIASFPGKDGQVDLMALLRHLASEKHCNEVLLEAGSTLSGAMLKAGLVDEVVTYIAPKVLGSDAQPLFTLPGMESLSEHIRLEILDVEMLGKDCKMRSLVLGS